MTASHTLRIRMSHTICGDYVTFHVDYDRVGNAAAQFEGELSRIVGEETGPLRAEVERLTAEVDRLSGPAMTLIMCDGCERGTRYGDTADGLCLRCQVERLKVERDDYAHSALAGLGGLICTPVEGYVKSTGPGGLRADFRELRKEWFRMQAEVGRLTAENARLVEARDFYLAGCTRMSHEIEQVLGKALGYPALYPDASDVDDGTVCVGDHTAVSLADEAAERIGKLTVGGLSQ